MIEDFTEYCKKREGDLVGSKLDNEDLIDYERMKEYWKDYVKLFLPDVVSSTDLITKINKYAQF